MQILQDPVAFPDFTSCPSEHDIDLQYYSTTDGCTFRPSRHWCLLAEIVRVESFIRVRLIVRDRSGNIFPVAFYPENGEVVKVAEYKVGHTVAILYPHQHGFLDMSVGIRQEGMNTIQVIPLTVLDISNVSNIAETVCCGACGDKENKLLKCARCGLISYCGKDCQTKDWKAGHKRVCKGFKLVKQLCDRNWNNFQDFWYFPL